MPYEEPDYVSEALLGTILVASPFLFGTTEGWSRGVICGFAFALLLRRHSQYGIGARALREGSPFFWGAVGLFILAILQATRSTPPEALALAWGPSTTSRALTLSFALDWACYAALLLCAPSVYSRPGAISRLTWLILILGATLTAAGIAQRLAGDTHYFGIRRINPLNNPFGPFPNKNHAGTVIAMSVCAGAGLCSELAARRGNLFRDGKADEVIGRGLVLSCLILTVIGGLVASRARAPLLAVAIATAVLAAFVLHDRMATAWRKGILTSIFTLTMLGAWFELHSNDSVLYQIASGSANSFPFRLAMVHDALRMIVDFPVFGVGLGAYRVVSPLYNDPILKNFFVDYVHCDPLQLTAEAGIGAAALFYALLFSTLARAILHSYRKSEESKHVELGLSFGCVTAILHQLVDFPSRIPGAQVVFVVCLAAVWGGTTPQRPAGSPPSFIHKSLFALALAAIWSVAYVPKVAAAYFDLMASRTIPPSTHYYRSAALSWEPTFERQCAMASEYARSANENPAARIVLWRHALRHTQAALDLEPFRPDLRRFHADLLNALGRKADARGILGPR